MTVPIIEVENKQPDEKISLSLRPEIAHTLRAYGEYAHGSSMHHVITAALRRLFDADKGFKTYLVEHPEAGTISSQKGKRMRRNKASNGIQKATVTA